MLLHFGGRCRGCLRHFLGFHHFGLEFLEGWLQIPAFLADQRAEDVHGGLKLVPAASDFLAGLRDVGRQLFLTGLGRIWEQAGGGNGNRCQQR